MSVTESKSLIDFMEGKNVLVFDTETTGLPDPGPAGFNTYWPYQESARYKKSRIVSIAWSYIPNFSQANINSNNIVEYIRRPEDFTEIPTAHIHGITYEKAVAEGITLYDILANKGLADAIKEADYIVAHNVKFDYNILQADLFRIIEDYPLVAECINHLRHIEEENRLICTAMIGRTICKIEYKGYGACSVRNSYESNKKQKTNIKYKTPKLVELYKHYYGKEFDNQHNASADVWALLEIMKCL